MSGSFAASGPGSVWLRRNRFDLGPRSGRAMPGPARRGCERASNAACADQWSLIERGHRLAPTARGHGALGVSQLHLHELLASAKLARDTSGPTAGPAPKAAAPRGQIGGALGPAVVGAAAPTTPRDVAAKNCLRDSTWILPKHI